jgi:hypothetical protein
MRTAAEVNHDKQKAALTPKVVAALADVSRGLNLDSHSLLATLLVFAKLTNPGLLELVQEILYSLPS